MRNYPIELLEGMLERYSPSGSEAELAKFLNAEMSVNGFESRIDRTGNIVATHGHEGPRILMCGHMDTVPGKIPVRTEGDALFGRGAVDAKSSLAAMIVGATKAKNRSAKPFQITLVGAVEEETTSRGVREFIKANKKYDLAIFGEPSGASNIVIGYKGSLRLRFKFQTDGGHSASPWIYTSSFEEATLFWERFQKHFLRNKAPSKFEELTGCVTSMACGGPGNSVPSGATLEIDVRIPPGIKPAELVERVRSFAENRAWAQRGVRIDLEVYDPTEAVLAPESSEAISAFRWSIRRILGDRVALVKKTGTSDMNLFAKSQAIPMLTYGPGDSRLDHTNGEYVKVSEYSASIDVYEQALPRFVERYEAFHLSSTNK